MISRFAGATSVPVRRSTSSASSLGDDPAITTWSVGDAGLPGEQRQERFVFHLPQPPEADRRTRTAQPDRALHGRQERRVVRVAAVDLHDEFVAVRPGGGDGELAGGLPGRDAEVGR